MRSLRLRLILTHILPLVVTVPLIGLVLVRILQTQILLSNLQREIQAQAVMLVEVATQQVNIWYSAKDAQLFVNRVSPTINAQVMLIDPHGYLLAASDPAQKGRVGEQVKIPALSDVLSGQSYIKATYDPTADTDVIEMIVPVVDTSQRLLGIIRLNLPVSATEKHFSELRNIVFYVLGSGLLLGILLGWGLAYSLEHPLDRTTKAIEMLSTGQKLDPLPEKGPEQIRQLLRAFNTLAYRLRTLEENRRRLLANLIHELGRPLGALQSAIQALQGGAEEDTALRHELLAGMDGEIQRLRRLLNDLAHLHQQVIGSLELNLQAVSLKEWLANVLPPWREAALRKGLGWNLQISDDLPPIRIDSDRLAQALGNLLSNAIQYTPSGGSIMIEATQTTEVVQISVSDTGPGIPPDEQPLVFTPFFRGSVKGRFPHGMGLGLSIARELVQAHGGTLELAGSTPNGSKFTIRLPVHPSHNSTEKLP